MSKDKFFPGEQFEAKTKIDSRKSSFGKLARLIQNSGTAWVTSYPGLPWMTFDALDGSDVPARLRVLGYDPINEGEGERILVAGITEHFVRDADGQLSPLTEASTKPIAETRLHAGIVKVKRYVFEMP